MLLGEYCPYRLVCGAHLFKYAWRSYVSDVLGFDNINDVKNGLLLLKPLEEAFDAGYLIFERKDGQFVAHWLGGVHYDNLEILDLARYPWKSNDKMMMEEQSTFR
ncbi:hypothetical protein TSOC_004373, partial [Tetrabaena socialis]